MSLERVAVEHLPPGYAIYAALFLDVRNAAFLQSQLVARNAAFEYAFVDAAAVVSRAHLVAAVYKAVLAHAGNSLKTPNMHAETVLSLSPSVNIAEAYRRFGVSADTKALFAIKILYPVADDDSQAAADDVWAHLRDNVQGTAVPLSDATIEACTDMAKVKKYFKLNGVPSLTGRNVGGATAVRKETELLVLGAMALRGL